MIERVDQQKVKNDCWIFLVEQPLQTAYVLANAILRHSNQQNPGIAQSGMPAVYQKINFCPVPGILQPDRTGLYFPLVVSRKQMIKLQAISPVFHESAAFVAGQIVFAENVPEICLQSVHQPLKRGDEPVKKKRLILRTTPSDLECRLAVTTERY